MQTLIDYAKSWIGRPYIWGGDDFSGWDCSGLVQEILASVGLDPLGDQNAQGLYEYFLSRGRPNIKAPGSIAFFGKPKIIHVAFHIDANRIVEAGGGGPTTTSVLEAEKQNAFVRIRPYIHRADYVSSILPFYPIWLSPLDQNQSRLPNLKVLGHG